MDQYGNTLTNVHIRFTSQIIFPKPVLTDKSLLLLRQLTGLFYCHQSYMENYLRNNMEHFPDRLQSFADFAQKSTSYDEHYAYMAKDYLTQIINEVNQKKTPIMFITDCYKVFRTFGLNKNVVQNLPQIVKRANKIDITTLGNQIYLDIYHQPLDKTYPLVLPVPPRKRISSCFVLEASRSTQKLQTTSTVPSLRRTQRASFQRKLMYKSGYTARRQP